MESLCVLLLLLVTVTAQGEDSCNHGDVDLIQDGGSSKIAGYVRYCLEGQWRSVCRKQDHNWDSNEAKVACRQLGYQGGVPGTGCPSDLELDASTFINDTVTTLCNASLNGSESSLQDCIISTIGSCRCHRTARLRCDPVCSLGELRLVPMSNNSVEVCVGGRWIKDQTNFSEGLAEYICGSPTQSISCYECCTDYEQGHYRVENDTVLQVCVDLQWTTVQNTSQLLTLVQEDIDQLFNETLTQCPNNDACLQWLLSFTSTLPQTTIVTEHSPTSVTDGLPLPIPTLIIISLAALSLILAVGWMFTCVVAWRRSTKQKTLNLRQSGVEMTETTLYDQQSHYNQQLHTMDPFNCSTTMNSPNYESVTQQPDTEDHYEAMKASQICQSAIYEKPSAAVVGNNPGVAYSKTPSGYNIPPGSYVNPGGIYASGSYNNEPWGADKPPGGGCGLTLGREDVTKQVWSGWQ